MTNEERAREILQTIFPCGDCEGDGWLHLDADNNKRTACEACGGHEDAPGDGTFADSQMIETVTAAFASAVAAERQRCAKAVCYGCANGWAFGGSRYTHINPVDRQHIYRCDASGIWALDESPTARGEASDDKA